MGLRSFREECCGGRRDLRLNRVDFSRQVRAVAGSFVLMDQPLLCALAKQSKRWLKAGLSSLRVALGHGGLDLFDCGAQSRAVRTVGRATFRILSHTFGGGFNIWHGAPSFLHGQDLMGYPTPNQNLRFYPLADSCQAVI
jgi:hypothetical protein